MVIYPFYQDEHGRTYFITKRHSYKNEEVFFVARYRARHGPERRIQCLPLRRCESQAAEDLAIYAVRKGLKGIGDPYMQVKAYDKNRKRGTG